MSSSQVIVNADDFGLHPAVNRGICRAHQEGIVTSTSLIPCGRAFGDAVERLNGCPDLDVGVHLTLVEERPVSPPEQIPSLVNRDGRMPASYREFTRGWLSGRIRHGDVRRELESQIQRVLRAGLHPTHIDGHQHVHCLPGLWPMVSSFAEEYHIAFIRLPRFESLRIAARTWTDFVLRAGVNVLADIHSLRWPSASHRTDHLKGSEFSGRMTSETLLRLLGALRPGLTEILVHPGEDHPDLQQRYGHWRGFDWAAELAAVTDERVVALCTQGAFQLTRFSEALS